MSRVKTFRINPEFGIPDKDVRVWLDECEQNLGIIKVVATFIPALGKSDPRLTLIVTKLDDA